MPAARRNRGLGSPVISDPGRSESPEAGRGRLAATSTRPSTLVRLEGTALATVTQNRLTGITIHALEAARVEHA